MSIVYYCIGNWRCEVALTSALQQPVETAAPGAGPAAAVPFPQAHADVARAYVTSVVWLGCKLCLAMQRPVDAGSAAGI
jgi:hypothetical protein